MLALFLFLVSCQLYAANGRGHVLFPRDPTSVFGKTNETCICIAKQDQNSNPSALWQAADGDSLMENLHEFFETNKMICKDCLGQDKDACKSQNPDCKRGGLRDQATVNGIARYDRAAAIFSGDPHLRDSFLCSTNSDGCRDMTVCMDCANGPGTYLILKSLQNLSNSFRTIIGEIEEASSILREQLALVPDPFARTFAQKWALEVDSSLFEHWLSGAGDDLSKTYVNFSDALFTNGSAQYNQIGGKPPVVTELANIIKFGSLLTLQKQPRNAVQNYYKVLFQQLAMSTWAYVAKDKLQHMPYITFDTVPCAAVNPKALGSLARNALFKKFSMDSGITIDGKCYYLLDAQPGGHHSNTCEGRSAPEGATNDALKQNAATFQGITVADWVVPAVKGFQANGNANGYPTAIQNGQMLDDPLMEGAVSIPVCDFVQNQNAPGKGCPQLGKPVTNSNNKKACAVF